MSDEATSKSGKTWIYVVGFVASLPVCYILLAGPLVVLMWRGVLPTYPVKAVYDSFDEALRGTSLYPAWEGYLRAWLSVTGTTVPHFR